VDEYVPTIWYSLQPRRRNRKAALAETLMVACRTVPSWLIQFYGGLTEKTSNGFVTTARESGMEREVP
jgi:hypothetical protein